MPWKNGLKADSGPWLLENESPGVRYLALKQLRGLGDEDPALEAAARLAHQEGPIAAALAEMRPEGFWVRPGHGYNPKYHSAVWSLILLAQLGASIHYDERIATACSYLLDHNLTAGGLFTCTGAPSGTVDCLQGNLCRALVELGCDDPRLEQAFEWLARSVTGEGVAPGSDAKALPRYYSYKCGPGFACGANHGQSCAWGAVKVLLALGACPEKYRDDRYSRAVQMGVDFLFSVNPATAAYPSGKTGQPNKSWWKFGFPVFYVTDVMQIAEALECVGCGQDPRLKHTLDFIREKQDGEGRWRLEYSYAGKTWGNYGEKGEASPWVTLRALKVLKNAG